MALTAGTRLGSYEVLGLIGAGGMGEVYKARDTRLDRLVAVKVLPRDLAADPDRRRRFEQEARTISSLNHPHICVLHDVGEVDLPITQGPVPSPESPVPSPVSVSYLVMEYVEGQALSERIRAGGLPLPQFLSVSIQLADAVGAAHQRGIVHRDLKPANVMVTEEGRVKVLDFGLARLKPQAAAAAEMTRTAPDSTGEGRIVGTTSYMSPEQVEGKPLDQRSDIFSLGVILYEMATGYRPFQRQSTIALLSAILEDTPRAVTEVDPRIPRELERIINRCLTKDRERRYQNAKDLRNELEELKLELDSGKLAAQASAPARALRRNRTWRMIGAALLGIAGLAAAAAWTVSYLSGSAARALAFKERDWILIADFDNQTQDAVFDRSLKTALTVGIQQSQYVNVFPDGRVQEALQRMRKPPAERIDEALGSEIAQREGIKAVLVCSIAHVGEVYSLTARLVDPKTHAAVLTEARQSQGKDRVLDTLDGLARHVRGRLGESLTSISEQGVPLPTVTTASLEALKNYSEGLVLLNRGRRDDAQAPLRRAVELDPEFALAHAAVATTYQGYGYYLNGALAEHHFTEAIKRLDRVSERERLEIQALYHGVKGRYEQAAGFHGQLVARYPNDPTYHFALAQDYRVLRRFPDALAEYGKALQLDPASPRIKLNLAGTHGDQREWAQMARYYKEVFDVEPTLATDLIYNHQYGWALLQLGRNDEAKAVFKGMLALEPGKQARGHRSLGILALYEGRLSDARRELEEARRLNETSGRFNNAGRDLYYLAEGQALLTNRRDAIGLFHRALALSEKVGWTMLSLRLSVQLSRAGRPADAKPPIDAARKRVEALDRTERSDLLRAEAEFALAEGRTAEGLELLKQAMAVNPWIVTSASLARGLERSGLDAEAIAAYEQIVARGPEPWEGHVEWAVAHLALARLYLRAGRIDDARRTCERLQEVWKDADADLPAVTELRAMLARLRAAG